MRAIIVRLINAGEDIAANVGTSRELCKKGWEQVVEVLFLGVPKIEVEICHGD